jgi:hypothetical protein
LSAAAYTRIYTLQCRATAHCQQHNFKSVPAQPTKQPYTEIQPPNNITTRLKMCVGMPACMVHARYKCCTCCCIVRTSTLLGQSAQILSKTDTMLCSPPDVTFNHIWQVDMPEHHRPRAWAGGVAARARLDIRPRLLPPARTST